MKKILFAAAAALVLLCSPAADAQNVIVPWGGVESVAITGTLTTITTDTVRMSANGSQWATVRFKAVTAGTATATAQYSNDGTNWLSAPYARLVSTVSANPTVQAISNTTLTTGDTWEVPLPGNATDFRLLCGATGTVTTVKLFGGTPYVSGVPVIATLYDVTETNIADGLTTTVDFSGWNNLQAVLVSPTTQSWTAQAVDDAGTVVGVAITTTAPSTVSQLVGVAEPAAANTIANNVNGVWPIIDRRIKYTLAAGGSATKGRARIVVRR